MTVRLNWEKWFNMSRFLPQDVMGDEKTGCFQLATAKGAFEKYIEIMTGEIGAKEKEEAKKSAVKRKGVGKSYPCMVDRETLMDYFTKAQRVALLSDDDFYQLNPEYWDEFGIVEEI